MRLTQLKAERARLWDAFMEAGGRGVDLAEKIDRLDAEIETAATRPALAPLTVAYMKYAEGYEYGISWALADRQDAQPPHAELERLRVESQTASRWSRAFYLGALRGYREIARSLRGGRWGT